MNRAWRERLGYEVDELVSLSLKDVLWPDAADATLQLLKRVEEGEKVPDFETIFWSKQRKKIDRVQLSLHCSVSSRAAFSDTAAIG